MLTHLHLLKRVQLSTVEEQSGTTKWVAGIKKDSHSTCHQILTASAHASCSHREERTSFTAKRATLPSCAESGHGRSNSSELLRACHWGRYARRGRGSAFRGEASLWSHVHSSKEVLVHTQVEVALLWPLVPPGTFECVHHTLQQTLQRICQQRPS
jgi:hypothetical protein